MESRCKSRLSCGDAVVSDLFCAERRSTRPFPPRRLFREDEESKVSNDRLCNRVLLIVCSLIRDDANLQWSSLPPQFRLETSLKDCNRPPKDRDFLVGTLLNHLHVHFLLHLQLQIRVNEPGPELVSIAARMFTLVIESVLLKDTLAYSGTTLDWKVRYTHKI